MQTYIVERTIALIIESYKVEAESANSAENIVRKHHGKSWVMPFRVDPNKTNRPDGYHNTRLADA